MAITHMHLRKRYSEFWDQRGHKNVPAIPLIPKDDPTTLFTGSGMQQLVPNLLGELHPLGKKLYNIQPCFRSQDIEEVGDNRHTTFFEMMGNWSLGDYFKTDQLQWFWEFLTKELDIPKEKLYVSVFNGSLNLPADDESYAIWKKLGVEENHIFKYGPEKNWWSRAGVPENMPVGEPGGPDSEVFYEFTQVPHNQKFGKACHPNCDCGRFLEIGNSVFMQYKKNKDGSFSPLPRPNVDFGGGLERMLSAVNDNPDIFKTDLYFPLIELIEKTSGKDYSDKQYVSKMRVIADHIKAATFQLAQGVLPSNKEQGYVLRRLLRRSATKAYFIEKDRLDSNFFKLLVRCVFQIYSNYFKETSFVQIENEVSRELRKFRLTLERGLIQLDKTLNDKKNLGLAAFNLSQSYGFPLEITIEILKERGVVFSEHDQNQFNEAKQAHINLSRISSVGKFKGGLADENERTLHYHTATHLLHQALFDVLGSEIRQEGSNITKDRLRFDFYSTKKPTPDQITKVQEVINAKINEQLPVEFKILPKEEAEKIGAKSFFREKYPDMVKVYFVGNYSKEFCGGPHVANTKEIGKITIYKTEKIGSNIYRIYAK